MLKLKVKAPIRTTLFLIKQKNNYFLRTFFSKFEENRTKLRLRKQSLTKSFNFCALALQKF